MSRLRHIAGCTRPSMVSRHAVADCRSGSGNTHRARSLVTPFSSGVGDRWRFLRLGLSGFLGIAHCASALPRLCRGGPSMTEDLEHQHRLNCSVIVTTWRRPVLLRATLAALLRQCYTDFEIVVV